MGVFFKIRSPAFIEDIYISEEAHHDPKHFVDEMYQSFDQVNCNNIYLCNF